jgi:hypothetical protein
VSSSLRHPSGRALGRAFVALLPLVAAACTSVQAGSQTGHDGDETGSGACEETVTVLGSLEEATALGFTAGEVLAQAEGTFESPIVWSAPGEIVAVGPEQGEGRLTLTVAHAGGEIRHVASTPRDVGGGAENDGGMEGGPALGGDVCKSRVEIDVQLTMVTSGGALNDTVPAIVASSDPRHVTLSAELDPDALAGSLEVTPAMEGFTLTKLTVSGGMAAGTSYGSIAAQVELDDGEVAGAGFGAVAQWPTAQSCDGAGVPLPFDTTLLGFTGDDVLALAEGAEATFTWDDGAETPLALSLEATGEVACVSVGGGHEPAGISFPAKLHMTSGDERIASAVDVTVIAAADAEGGLAEVQFMNQGYMLGVAPGDFASTYGISGVDVSAYDQASITVNGTFAESGSTGALEVLGLEIPPCIEDPSSVPPGGGCEGVNATELGGGTWR